MADVEPLLNRTQVQDDPDPEQKHPSSLRRLGVKALTLGALLLACGVVLFVSAHWNQIGPGARYLLVLAMVAVLHLGGGWARASHHGVSTALHAVGTISTGVAIALVGQIFNIQEHWPAAVLLWAVAAAAGWMLLRDEAQQVLTLLLFPAWIISEFEFATEAYVGQSVYLGRFLVVWAVLYLTFFLGSEHKIVRRALFGVSAVAGLVGTQLLLEGWRSIGDQIFLPPGLKTWGWVEIAVLPLLLAVFKFRKCVAPVTVAIVFAIALPWCHRIRTAYYSLGDGYYHKFGETGQYFSVNEPSLAAHALVAIFCAFLIWWGVRQASKALMNLGIAGVVLAVAWLFLVTPWKTWVAHWG